MNLRIAGLGLLITLVTIESIAQETFTDEELTKYANLMRWVDQEKKVIVDFISTTVKENENLSGAKYNGLSKADRAGDVTTVEATTEELEAYNGIKEATDKKRAELSADSKEKIMSDLGANLYNRLKKTLKTDEVIKARYQAIYETLKSEEIAGSQG